MPKRIVQPNGFPKNASQLLKYGGVTIRTVVLLVADFFYANQPALLELRKFAFDGACPRAQKFYDLPHIEAAVRMHKDQR